MSLCADSLATTPAKRLNAWHSAIRRALLCSAIAGAFACGTEQASAPEEQGSGAATIDDDASVADGIVLPRTISVKLKTAKGTSARRVRVEWAALDGGSIAPAFTVTNDSGFATAAWTLGPDTIGVHHALASAAGFRPITVSAQYATAELGTDVFRTMRFVTFDGAGQTVHPDYVRIDGPSLFGNFLAVTPYAGGNSFIENPTLYHAQDFVRWVIPDSAPSPVVRPEETHLSDPDIVYDPLRGELMMYYRQVGDLGNSLWLVRTGDAVHWTKPQLLTRVANHQLVSPSVVRRSENEWLMWSIDGHEGCSGSTTDADLRRSTDGIEWGPPMRIALNQPGVFPWHIEVQWIPAFGEYWALYNVKVAGSCSTTELYLATSTDGVNWKTYPSPVLTRGKYTALADIVYRSTFVYDPATDLITFWYSGATYKYGAYAWGTVAHRRRRAEVFASIETRGFGHVSALRAGVPPLKDPP